MDTTYRLDPERVEKVFLDCLFKEGEDTTDHVIAEGITVNVGFHSGRLAEYREEIKSMLYELPDTFRKSGGGGWSFLQACDDRHGAQWTGLHQRMEQLFQLGIAADLAEWQLSREMWAALPGGMPYVVFKDE